ncbi:MAG TPA: hypothetical protein VG496_06560 [Myxococcales bacterium]|nr:hypothetical protein [Myxococcales bacterium]
MAIALSTLLAISVSVSADPGTLTLGKDATAHIEVRVKGAFGRAVPNARVTLSTNMGSIGDAVAAGGGEYSAEYTPPKSRAPAVALLAADAEVDGEHSVGWLALPLAGSDSMTFETKPKATVWLHVADREFGPVVANAKGEAQIDVVVPPGVNKAVMHIEDPLGNTADRQLDLDPPPFPRLRVVPVGPPRAPPGDSLELQAFVVRQDGSADPEARVTAATDRGEVGVSRNRRGVVTVSWEAPEDGSGDAAIEVEAQGERAELRASIGAAGDRQHRSWFRGLGTPSFGLFGTAGVSSYGAATLGGTVEAAAPMKSSPFELLLELGTTHMFHADQVAPPAYLGRQERASANTFSAELGIRGTSAMSSFDVHAALLAGIQQTWMSATSQGTPPTSRSESQLGLRGSAAAGASFRAGPGRFLVQVQASIVPFGTASLEAPLGGIGLQAGYVIVAK